MVRDLQNFSVKKTGAKVRISAVAKGKKMIILLVDFRPFPIGRSRKFLEPAFLHFIGLFVYFHEVVLF